MRFGVVLLTLSALTLAACSGEDSDESSAIETPAVETEPVVEPEAMAADEPEVTPAEETTPEDDVAPEPEPTPEEATPEEAAPEEAAPAEETPAPAEEEPAAEPEPAAGDPDSNLIIGNAEATESATIMVDGTRVMLYGLESVYPPQVCYIDGVVWECWAAAVRQLQTYLAEGPVTCTPVADADPYGRILGLCEQGGVSLNERYVRSGFALAIEDEMPEYAELEAAAREDGIGLWQGTFMEPEDFRMSRAIMQRRP